MKTETCIDYPEANGRAPQTGDVAYTLTFPLEDGSELTVRCGRETIERFAEMIGSMMLDNEVQS